MSLPRAFQDKLDRRIGGMLIAAAAAVQQEMWHGLSTAYPPASKPGQYPHYRTHDLRDGIVYEPQDELTAGRERKVRIGYSVVVFYGAILELKRGRLGLAAALQKVKGTVGTLLAGARRAAG